MPPNLDWRFAALALALSVGAGPTRAAAAVEVVCHFSTNCKAQACKDDLDQARDACNKSCPGAELDSNRIVPTCGPSGQRTTPEDPNPKRPGNIDGPNGARPDIPARQGLSQGEGAKR